MDTNYESLYQKAYDVAVKAHEGQVDKCGKPYIEHVKEVSRRTTYFKNEYAPIVALLHDTVEDTDITESDLRKEFPDYIVDAVMVMSHDKSEPYDEYVARVKENDIARIVKLCDLSHNMDLDRLNEVTDYDIQRVLKYARSVAYLARE